MKNRKVIRKSEIELERLQDLEVKDIIEMFQFNKLKVKKVRISLLKNGELWIKRESPIGSSAQKCQSICSQERLVKVLETGDEINVFLHVT